MGNKSWSSEEIEDLSRLSDDAHAAKWGRTNNAVYRKRNKLNVAAPATQAAPDPVWQHREKLADLAVAKEKRQRLDNEAAISEFFDNLDQSIRRLEPIPVPAVRLRKDSGKQRELILLHSDLHCGAKYDSRQLGGLGGFDLETYHRRLDILRGAVTDAIFEFGVSRLNVFCIGDMIDGQDMHDTQAYHLDTHLTDQIAQAGFRLADDMRYYASIVGKVAGFGVGGNHARQGKRGKVPYAANFDRLVYKIAARFTENISGIRWHLPPAWFQVVQRGTSAFVLVHGDDVKAWMGIPYYGLQRAQMRYKRMLRGVEFDYICTGHFHTPMKDDYIMANGSLIGATEYSAKDLVVTNLPSQKLVLLDRDEGVQWVYDVPLADWDDLRQIDVYSE